jgi:hypothetical protein
MAKAAPDNTLFNGKNKAGIIPIPAGTGIMPGAVFWNLSTSHHLERPRHQQIRLHQSISTQM